MNQFRKFQILVVFIIMLFTAGCDGQLADNRQPGLNDQPSAPTVVDDNLMITPENGDTFGPGDILTIPLESVPDPGDAVYHPEVIDPVTGASVQVLRVLGDPREIPLSRWMVRYYQGQTIYKDDLLWDVERLGGGYIGVAVYVRTRAGSTLVEDPFSTKNMQWSDILRSTLDGNWMGAGCVPPDYLSGKEYSYAGEDYDPSHYTPPKPWYIGMDDGIPPGETNEGWLLCFSPDVPISMVTLALVDNPNSNHVIAWEPVVDWSYSVGEQQYIPSVMVRNRVTDKVVYEGEAYVSIVSASKSGEKLFVYYTFWYPGLLDRDVADLYVVSFMFQASSNGTMLSLQRSSSVLGKDSGPALSGWLTSPLNESGAINQDIDIYLIALDSYSVSSAYLKSPWTIDAAVVTTESGIQGLCGDVPCFDPSLYPAFSEASRSLPKEPMPLLCPGDTGEGVTINNPLPHPDQIVGTGRNLIGGVDIRTSDYLYVPFDIDGFKNHFSGSSAIVYDASNGTVLRSYSNRFYYDSGQLILFDDVSMFASPQNGDRLIVIEKGKSTDLSSLYLFLDNNGPAWRLSCGN